MRSDTNLRQQFAAEGVDTRDYGSMPGVLDTNTEIEGRGRVLRSHSFSGHETNSLFANIDGQRFVEISGVSGADSVADGRGFATLDYDRDGRQDIVLVNTNEPQLQLFHNTAGGQAATNRALGVRLVGGAASPRDAYGAHVIVQAEGRTMRRELRCGDGFAVQNSATLSFGLGGAPAADSVEVRWPSGEVTRLAGPVPAGATLTVTEGEGEPAIAVLPPGSPAPAGPGPDSRLARPDLGRLALATPGDGPATRIRAITTMATWCAVCRSELPHFAHLRAKLPDGAVALYGLPVDEDDDAEKLAAYAEDHSPDYEILTNLPPAEKADAMAYLEARLGSVVLPSTLVLDMDGNVLLVKKGTPTVSDLRQALRRTGEKWRASRASEE